MNSLLVIPVGLLIGIVVSAPVGPVNVICIGRALHFGFWPAVLAGVGAALGDGLLALIAAFGISAAAEAVTSHSEFIKLVGGVILIVFGGFIIATPPHGSPRAAAHMGDSAVRIVPATFLITITNPGALLGFIGIFGGMIGNDLLPEGDYTAAALMVLAVSGGALLWWAGLAAFVSRIRHLLSERTLRRINIVSGILLAAFGGALILDVLLTHIIP